MARHPTAGPKRPLGLVLLSALLLIVALRGAGWIVVGGLVARRTPGLAGWLLSLLVMAVILAGAVGLLRLQEWARRLTLAVCSVYFGLTLANVVARWPRLRTGRVNLSLGVLNAAVALVVLASTWWYLNREDVRRLFRGRG